MSIPLTARFPDNRARRFARRIALDGASFVGEVSGSSRTALERHRVHFVYLHHVFPEEVDTLRTFIRGLKSNHQIIDYADAVSRVTTDRIDGRYVCFSFDDGFESCITAASVLEEEGIRAVFFVCPGLVGMESKALKAIFPRTLGSERRAMSWDDIEALVTRGHEIGSHTMTHPILANLSEDHLLWQLGQSRAELERRFGVVQHFAWPRGQFHHFSPTAARMVKEIGYTSCASAARGAHTSAATPSSLCIRRENIDLSWPLRHVRYFLARSARTSTSADNQWPRNWRVSDDRPLG